MFSINFSLISSMPSPKWTLLVVDPQKKPKETVSLFEGALQETLSAKPTTGKGFSSDLIQNVLQNSLLAKTLVVIGFDKTASN